MNREKEKSRDRALGKGGGETGTVKRFKLHGVTSRKTVPHRTSFKAGSEPVKKYIYFEEMQG